MIRISSLFLVSRLGNEICTGFPQPIIANPGLAKIMINGMTILWNWLTGSRVIPTQEYIEYFFSFLDVNKDGKVGE